ncbi:hypothetical protein JAAARDRAFT_67857 [Jaapia argillacea MUCL 33604]|uniref:amidase n=1 Tax=Jaapia argillacea MUCL 33604 TaxID=933084 RepID=A0A067PZY2_9AGAM|nr:hypothetical protein JAAARDRAFT_67857 [Jaapia argillacea MUCL 33604]
MLLSYLTYRNACFSKQKERKDRIQALPDPFHYSVTPYDAKILNQPVAETVSAVQQGNLSPSDVLLAYGKKALKAHEETNCLTEVMISKAQVWAEECNKQGPLAGIPVSLKDTVCVAGFDTSLGYATWVGKPSMNDSAIVRLLKDAGAVPFVKTNNPITLLSYECANDVFGRTANPHNSKFSPGGSTGGEAALLAYGGSRIGIGTDVAGSVRVPSHYSGVYTIKASSGRFVRSGNLTSSPGQEGVLVSYSPMARTLEDLETVWKAVMSMNPWEYDHSCLPIPWRDVNLANKTLKWGIIWDDGVINPSPACRRALSDVVSILQQYGHEVVTLDPPSPYEGFKIGSQLVADSCKRILTGESNDVGVLQGLRMLTLPRWLKWLYVLYLRHIRRDETYAGLVENFSQKTAEEYFALVTQREEYRGKWFEMWQTTGVDFVLTVPNALPAVPHGGMKEGFTNCLYAFLYNVLDYSAGVMPITRVDRHQDALKLPFKARNAIESGAYKLYDAEAMHGLPVGIQVVGRRLEEEKVMEGMKIIEALLGKSGKAYKLLEK